MVIKTSTIKFREINLLEWVSRARGNKPGIIALSYDNAWEAEPPVWHGGAEPRHERFTLIKEIPGSQPGKTCF